MTAKRGREISRCYIINSKGQVTLFIIIGIIILFTFAGILFVSKLVTKQPLLSAGEPVIAEVPQQFKPLQRYTENCLKQVGKRGLVLLGQQGGYISPELLGRYSASNPTESEGLDLESAQIPYWHYNSEPNTANKVLFASHQPKLQEAREEFSIETQLARFVDEKVGECLDEYAAFTRQGFKIKSGDRATKVQISEETVNFLLEMSLEAQRGGAQATLDRFFVKVTLPLKHYYEVANKITEAEKKYHFLEQQGLELLSVYSQKDSNYFPPTSDVTYELFSPLSWNEFSLKEKYKDLLISYIPMLRFLGSSNFYYTTFPEGNRLAQKVTDNMVVPLTGADDLEVSFDYFGWEPYFKTNSENGLIKPESLFVNFGVLTFGSQRYETHYDASYPVLVTLNDEAALNGEGYSFIFALESNIRNNRPAVSEEVRETYPRRILPLACNQEQRNSALLKTVVVDSFSQEPLELVRVGFSIPEQTECEIGVTDLDGVVEEKYPPVYGGVINFIKLGYLTSFYPIDTYKYQDKPLLLGYAVAEIAEPAKVIELDRIVSKKVKIKKKELKKCVTPLVCSYTVGPLAVVIPYKDISCAEGVRQCFFNQGQGLLLSDPVIELVANSSLSRYHDYYFFNKGLDLQEKEEVIITLERVGGFHNEVIGDEFTAVISVKGEETANVQLVPGIYKVSGLVTLKEEVVLPQDERCFQYDILTWETEECFTIDENKMENAVTGSLTWDLPETYLEIKPEDLYSTEEITFFVLTQDLLTVPEKISTTTKECGAFTCLPEAGCLFEICASKEISVPGRVVEDLQMMGKIAELSKTPTMRKSLEPTFS